MANISTANLSRAIDWTYTRTYVTTTQMYGQPEVYEEYHVTPEVYHCLYCWTWMKYEKAMDKGCCLQCGAPLDLENG